MASVFKAARERHIYTIKFKDQHGKQRSISSGTTDKSVALSISVKLEEDAERVRLGLPPRHIEITGVYLGLVTLKKPKLWAEAVKDYLAEMARQGSGPGTLHYRDLRSHLGRWGRDCGWRLLVDV